MNIEHFQKLKDEGFDPTAAYLKAKDMGYNTMKSVLVLRKTYGLSIVEAKSIIVATDNNDMTLSEYQESLIPIIEEVMKGIDKKDIVR